MSVSTLFNTSVPAYDSQSIRVYDLFVDGESHVEHIVTDSIEINNGVGSVTLTTDNSDNLVVSGAVKTDEIILDNGSSGQVILVTDNSDNLVVSGRVKTHEVILNNGTGQVILSTDNVGDLIVPATIIAPDLRLNYSGGNVLLTTDSSSNLISNHNITTPSITFTNVISSQSPLSVYHSVITDLPIPLNYLGSNTGELFCQFQRIGNLISVECRGYLTFSVGETISTVAIPAGFSPSKRVCFTLPLYNTAASPAFVNALCFIDVLGIITIRTAQPTPAGATVYYTGLITTPDNYDRYTFNYLY